MPRIPYKPCFWNICASGTSRSRCVLKRPRIHGAVRGLKARHASAFVRIENHDNSIVGVMFALETDLFAGANRRQILRLRIDDYACPSLVTELLR